MSLDLRAFEEWKKRYGTELKIGSLVQYRSDSIQFEDDQDTTHRYVLGITPCDNGWEFLLGCDFSNEWIEEANITDIEPAGEYRELCYE